MKNYTAYGFALLLLVQAMTVALNVVPNEEKHEELQASVFESSARTNNSSSPCGSNANYTSVYASAPYMVMENQSFTTTSYVYCEILNANMMLDYSIIGSNNSTVYSGNQSWTGANASSSNYTSTVSGLSAGYYVFHADLYVDGTLVDSDSDSFMVYANTSGGGGSGNNTSANDAHCLAIDNISMSSTYILAFDLVNICSIQINYPGVNASANHAGVSGLPNTSSWWYYAIGPNGSYNVSIQLYFDENVSNNTVVGLVINPTILNCGGVYSWHDCPDSSSNYTFTYVILSNNSGGNTTIDTDGDGVPDSLDAFPIDSNETSDNDGDGVGDNADTDDDNDGVSDSVDAFPTDSSETVDTDGDGVGNNADTDDDNDGVGDNLDSFPLDSSEAFDNDGDGVGDNADMDDDNDGVSDQEDAFPFDEAASNDSDADGVADAYDNCMTVFNPNQADADMDGIGTECDADESTGNNTGGNNTGGNTTGGNTTGGNDTGGNTTGGNTTGGNSTMLDTDGDGIDDAIDNCEFVANQDQADADGDGIGTACDDDESSSSDDESSSSDESDSVPSIGMLATSLCLIGAAVLVRRD